MADEKGYQEERTGLPVPADGQNEPPDGTDAPLTTYEEVTGGTVDLDDLNWGDAIQTLFGWVDSNSIWVNDSVPTSAGADYPRVLIHTGEVPAGIYINNGTNYVQKISANITGELNTTGDIRIAGQSISETTTDKSISFGGGLISFFGGTDMRDRVRMRDDTAIQFGTDNDFSIQFNSTNGTFEIWDSNGAEFVMSEGGTSKINAALNVVREIDTNSYLDVADYATIAGNINANGGITIPAAQSATHGGDNLATEPYVENRTGDKRTFFIRSDSTDEYVKLGRIDNGSSTKNGDVQARMVGATPNNSGDALTLDLYSSVGQSVDDTGWTEQGDPNATERGGFIITEEAVSSAENNYYLYARFPSFCIARIDVSHSGAFGGFDFTTGLASTGLIGTVIHDTINDPLQSDFKAGNITAANFAANYITDSGARVQTRDAKDLGDSGRCAAGKRTRIGTVAIPSGETATALSATMLDTDGSGLPTGVNLKLITGDATNGYADRATLISGDGSTKVDVQNAGSYTNTLSGTQIALVAIENTTSSEVFYDANSIIQVR